MLVLVDYDNLPDADRKLGADHIVRKIVDLVPEIDSAQRARVRLYGGWYESDRLTRRAQQLSAELRTCSPVRVPINRGDSEQVLLADIELVATSLLHPRVLVGNTFRRQRIRDGIECEQRPWLSCADDGSCPLSTMEAVFSSGNCPNVRCAVRLADLLSRFEQKVVDTMIVGDLACANEYGYSTLCVVSRDDDIWPGLCLAARFAKSLVLISPAASRRLPRYYEALQGENFRQALWS